MVRRSVRQVNIPELAALAHSADRFLSAVRALADNDVGRASALPGWTRAHLLTHVSQAADSRTGMLRAARAPRRALGGARDLAARHRGPVRGTVASLRSELEYHHVDLAAGYAPDDWPAEFVATQLRRVTALMDHRADAPSMTLLTAAAVRIGTVPPADVSGPPAAILAWLSGRGDGSGLDTGAAGLPSLPPLA